MFIIFIYTVLAAADIRYTSVQSVKHIRNISRSDEITYSRKTYITGRVSYAGNDTTAEPVITTFNNRIIYLDIDKGDIMPVKEHQYRYARIFGRLKKISLTLADNTPTQPKIYISPEKIILYTISR